MCLNIKHFFSTRKVRKDLIARAWVYFRRGYATYIAFLLSIANFIVIQYRLLVEYVPFLKTLFGSLLDFALFLMLLLTSISVLIGYIDYKRFSVSAEVDLVARASPWNKVLSRTLIELVRYSDIPEDKKKELIHLLSRYA